MQILNVVLRQNKIWGKGVNFIIFEFKPLPDISQTLGA